MKNIFRIFKNDVSRIRSNVIAMIVIMVLLLFRLFMHGLILLQAGIHYGNTGNLRLQLPVWMKAMTVSWSM